MHKRVTQDWRQLVWSLAPFPSGQPGFPSPQVFFSTMVLVCIDTNFSFGRMTSKRGATKLGEARISESVHCLLARVGLKLSGTHRTRATIFKVLGPSLFPQL
jgi:hypothetical protein